MGADVGQALSNGPRLMLHKERLGCIVHSDVLFLIVESNRWTKDVLTAFTVTATIGLGQARTKPSERVGARAYLQYPLCL